MGVGGLLRSADALVLDQRYDEMTATMADLSAAARGRTLFVAGDDATGRSELLETWAAGIAAGRRAPKVVGGRMDATGYVPWQRDADAAQRSLAAVKSALKGAGSFPLWLLSLPPGVDKLVGQLLSRGEDLVGLVARLIGARGPRQAATDVLRDVLRELCREGPAVCVIDSVDERTGALWDELAGLLSRQIAAEMALLLVLGLDGPRDLGAPRAGEATSITVARELTCELVDVASWHWLAPLTAADIERWTGPVTSDVASWLLELTDGCSGEVSRHWAEWQRLRLLERDREGRWRFASYDPSMDINGTLNGCLPRLVGAADAPSIEVLLGRCALESRRFIAQAAAIASDRDPDELVALFDAALIRDDAHPDGLLTREASTAVRGPDATHGLTVYRFARELDWMVLRRAGTSPGEKRHYARKLAQAIEELYGEHAATRADTLARLYALAHDEQRAGHYERLAGSTRTVA